MMKNISLFLMCASGIFYNQTASCFGSKFVKMAKIPAVVLSSSAATYCLVDYADKRNKQDQLLNDKKEKLAQSMNKNSLVEIKRSSSTATEEDTEKSDEASAEKLKNTTIKNINEAPSKSIKMHIRHLDKNLLLAMLSLRGA